MTDRGPLPPKLYFRIGEVAGLVGVEPHVLRYWEREFRTIRPTKSAKGQRVYSRRDVESLIRVRELLYGQGFTIAGARRKLREKGDADGDPDELAPAAAVEPVPVALAPVSTVTTRAGVPDRVRDELLALKAEVEALLEDMGGAP